MGWHFFQIGLNILVTSLNLFINLQNDLTISYYHPNMFVMSTGEIKHIKYPACMGWGCAQPQSGGLARARPGLDPQHHVKIKTHCVQLKGINKYFLKNSQKF